jgi:hypothetical protein
MSGIVAHDLSGFICIYGGDAYEADTTVQPKKTWPSRGRFSLGARVCPDILGQAWPGPDSS